MHDRSPASRLFDSHVHLDDPDRVPADIAPLLAAAATVGWGGALIAGYGPERFERARALCAARADLAWSAGLHPWWLAQNDAIGREAGWLQLVACLRAGDGPVAIGEIGVDRSRKSQMSATGQLDWFRRGLELAAAHRLPVVLHIVGWHGLALEAIERVGVPAGGVVHRYSGPAELVSRYEQMGLALSFGPDLFVRDQPKAIAAIVQVAADRLLVETDWPDGRLTYAEAVSAMARLVKRMAAWRGEDPLALAERLMHNARSLFGRSDPARLRGPAGPSA